MTTLREAAQQALEALEWFNKYGSEEHGPSLRGAECSLRTALAEPVQKRKPLTEEEIGKVAAPYYGTMGFRVEAFARAIERAHGITNE